MTQRISQKTRHWHRKDVGRQVVRWRRQGLTLKACGENLGVGKQQAALMEATGLHYEKYGDYVDGALMLYYAFSIGHPYK